MGYEKKEKVALGNEGRSVKHCGNGPNLKRWGGGPAPKR